MSLSLSSVCSCIILQKVITHFLHFFLLNEIIHIVHFYNYCCLFSKELRRNCVLGGSMSHKAS